MTSLNIENQEKAEALHIAVPGFCFFCQLLPRISSGFCFGFVIGRISKASSRTLSPFTEQAKASARASVPVL